MYKFIFSVLFALLFNFNATSQFHIIPEPNSIKYLNSSSGIKKSIFIKSDQEDRFELDQLKKILTSKGYNIVNTAKNASPIVLSRSNDRSFRPEYYSLNISKGSINIKAQTAKGIYYAIQTLDQILPNYSKEVVVQNVEIKDAPRFGWRGLMLDVSRHFFTVDEVKSYIDQMSKYKFNTFHWHLTDDNGWRIEIKALPRLTEIGAWRVQRFGKFNNRKDPQPGEVASYGGYYTQQQIKEVIQYASERHITIVPEVDIPGHSMALLAAYPELSTRKEAKYVNPGTAFSEWYGNGKFKMLIENTLNPVDEKVYETLDVIFSEIATLFPGEYIHAGGDEAYHGFWEEDENCKKFMSENNMKEVVELQSYFMKRVEKIISGKGKKMIGWDEILEGGIAEGAAVMSWRGLKGGIEAASHGHKVVMSPTTYAYLDYSQGDHSVEFPIYADLSLKKSYEFEPVPVGVDPSMILGAQGNLWTEQIPNLSHAFYMTYPRAFSIAETAWSNPELKNWSNFVKKVEHHIDLFEKDEIQINRSFRDPYITFKKMNNKIYCEMTCEVEEATIYYTIDQTFPDKKSAVFTLPFEVPEGEIMIKAVTYKDGQPYGRLINLNWAEVSRRIKKL